MSRERSRSPRREGNNGPPRVAVSDRLHNVGRSQRTHRTHTIPDFPWNDRDSLKTLTSANLKSVIIQFDVEVSDAIWKSGGKMSKISALIRHYRNWQRRGSNNNDNNEALPPLQRPSNNQIMINSDGIDADFFSQLLQNNDRNNNNVNEDIIILDENEESVIRFNEIMRGHNNNNNMEMIDEANIGGDHDIEFIEDINNNNNSNNNFEIIDPQIGGGDIDNNDNNNDEMNVNGDGGDMQPNNEEEEKQVIIDDEQLNSGGEDINNNNNNNNEIINPEQLNGGGGDDIENDGNDIENDEHRNNDNNNNEMIVNPDGGDMQPLLNPELNGAIDAHRNNENNPEIDLESDDDNIVNDININQNMINNPNLLSPDYVEMRDLLNRHGLQHVTANVIGAGLTLNHIPFVQNAELSEMNINSVGERAAFRAVMHEVSAAPPPPPPPHVVAPPPVPPPPVPPRHPEPNREQLQDFFLKGIGSVFSVMPATGQLPSRSGQIRHDFNNKTNNHTYRPIKHYIAPAEPDGSKNYLYSIKKTTKSVINYLNDKGVIVTSDIRDPENNVAHVGGHWSCKLSIPLIVPLYNSKTAESQEEIYMLMKRNSIRNGGYVNWWLFAALRHEPVTVRNILNWDIAPVFGQPIETNAPAIDINRQPRAFN